MKNALTITGVAGFYLKDGHTHPVCRKVLVTSETNDTITGYEIREGRVIRSFLDARNYLKTYNKADIARYGDYCRLKKAKRNSDKNDAESTLERYDLISIMSKV